MSTMPYGAGSEMAEEFTPVTSPPVAVLPFFDEKQEVRPRLMMTDSIKKNLFFMYF